MKTSPNKPFSSSTGTKLLLGVTGLLLFAYLPVHLAGNLMVFAGPSTFNGYSHLLISNPLIYPLEIGLGLIFLMHIYKAVTNYRANRQARPTPYYKKEWAGKPSRKTWSSTTMIWTGLFTLLFIVVHLVGLKFGQHYEAAGHPGVRDLYRLEVEHFANPLTVVFYVVSMVVIGFHLWHGFWSAFQSLAVSRPEPQMRLQRRS